MPWYKDVCQDPGTVKKKNAVICIMKCSHTKVNCCSLKKNDPKGTDTIRRDLLGEVCATEQAPRSLLLKLPSVKQLADFLLPSDGDVTSTMSPLTELCFPTKVSETVTHHLN